MRKSGGEISRRKRRGGRAGKVQQGKNEHSTAEQSSEPQRSGISPLLLVMPGNPPPFPIFRDFPCLVFFPLAFFPFAFFCNNPRPLAVFPESEFVPKLTTCFPASQKLHISLMRQKLFSLQPASPSQIGQTGSRSLMPASTTHGVPIHVRVHGNRNQNVRGCNNKRTHHVNLAGKIPVFARGK